MLIILRKFIQVVAFEIEGKLSSLYEWRGLYIFFLQLDLNLRTHRLLDQDQHNFNFKYNVKLWSISWLKYCRSSIYTFYYLSLLKKIFKRFPLSWDIWSLTPHPTNPNSRILFLWFNKVVTFCVCGMNSYFWPLINSHHSKENYQNQSVIFFHTFVKRRFMCSIHFPCLPPPPKKNHMF